MRFPAFRMPPGKQFFAIAWLKLNIEFQVNVNVAPVVSPSVAGTQLAQEAGIE